MTNSTMPYCTHSITILLIAGAVLSTTCFAEIAPKRCVLQCMLPTIFGAGTFSVCDGFLWYYTQQRIFRFSCAVPIVMGCRRQHIGKPAGDDGPGDRCYSTPRINGSDDHNPLWTFFTAREKGPGIHKWIQYFDIYHRYFNKFVGKEVHMLEIGVQSGGSLDLWRHYFGNKLVLYGIGINPYTKALFDDPPHTNIFIGDQENRTFWAEVKSKVPRIDIVLDDGGHTAKQQITTFEELHEFVSENGIYMIEDVAPATGPGSLLEYTHQHMANIFGHYVGDAPAVFRGSEPNRFTTTTGIHCE